MWLFRCSPIQCVRGCIASHVDDLLFGSVMPSNPWAGPLGAPLDKVCSESCNFVLLAGSELMGVRTGRFNILDARGNLPARVCRSSYGAEKLCAEAAFDVRQLCRECTWLQLP